MWKKFRMICLAATLVITGISFPEAVVQPVKAEAAETYMVYFDSQGGTAVNPVTNLTYGSYLQTLPTPTRDGFIFDGWYTSPDYTTRFYAYTPIKDNTVLFAKWREKTIVYLTASYATPTEVEETLLDLQKLKVEAVYSDGTKKELTAAEYEISDMKVSIGFNSFTVRAGNTATSFFVQGIKEPQYTVTFYSNGGSYVPSIPGIKEKQTISLPAEPYKAGYEFKGWYLDNNTFKNEFTSEYPIVKNLIVFAKWEKLEVVVEEPEYELNTVEMVLKVNAQQSLFIESYDPYLEVEYFSEDWDIATVNQEGIVEGKTPGVTTVWVITPEGEMLDCTVMVEGTKAKSIKLNATSKTLKKGKTFQIKTTFSPAKVSSKKLSYTSSNKKIAKVSTKGKITALKKGSCTITVKTKDGSGLKKKIKIKVV